MAEKVVFILGGARGGKSRFAQDMAAKLGEKVLFVATGEPLDEEMDLRIKQHKRTRPENWRTVEIASGVGRKLKGQIGDAQVVLLDCLTLLISNILTREAVEPSCSSEEEGQTQSLVDDVPSYMASDVEKRVVSEIEDLIQCIDTYEGIFIVVSNEVGLGLVPESKLGRVYRDLLGNANQLLARHATDVYFMASGIPIKIRG